MLLRKTPTGVLYRHKTHNLSVEDIRQQRYTFRIYGWLLLLPLLPVPIWLSVCLCANVCFYFVHLAACTTTTPPIISDVMCRYEFTLDENWSSTVVSLTHTHTFAVSVCLVCATTYVPTINTQRHLGTRTRHINVARTYAIKTTSKHRPCNPFFAHLQWALLCRHHS